VTQKIAIAIGSSDCKNDVFPAPSWGRTGEGRLGKGRAGEVG
jgi:hypothetical protein